MSQVDNIISCVNEIQEGIDELSLVIELALGELGDRDEAEHLRAQAAEAILHISAQFAQIRGARRALYKQQRDAEAADTH